LLGGSGVGEKEEKKIVIETGELDTTIFFG
jgi:hypothetical protein